MGHYVEANLLNGESIVSIAKVHWAIYIAPIIVSAFGLLLLGSTPVIFILGLIWLAFRLLGAWTTELALTNKRVIAKTGIIRRYFLDVSLSKVEGVNFQQGIVGRLLGYGSLAIRGTGAGAVPIPYISHPEVFKREVGNLLHAG